MTKHPTLLLALLLAAAPALGAPDDLSAKDAAKIASAAKKNIAHKLKDPNSAQFRGLFISTREHESAGKTHTLEYLCGEINAKNSMGGYTGFRRFVAVSAVPGGFIDNPDDESASAAFEEVVWAQSCTRKVRAVS